MKTVCSDLWAREAAQDAVRLITSEHMQATEAWQKAMEDLSQDRRPNNHLQSALWLRRHGFPQGALTLQLLAAADFNDEVFPSPEDARRAYEQELEANEAEREGENPPNWVADEGLWAKAKRASMAAFNRVSFPFVTWWYLRHGGSKK